MVRYIGTDNCRRRPNVHGVFSAVRLLGTTALNTTKLQRHATIQQSEKTNNISSTTSADLTGMLGTREYNSTKVAARDHVKRFLETCGDYGLERRLCHVKVYDIHELEEMIIEILKWMIANRQNYLLNPDPEVMIPVDRNVATTREMAIRAVIVVTETSDAVAMTHKRSHESPLQKERKHLKPKRRRSSRYLRDYNDYDNHDGWNADESRYTDEEREEYNDSTDEDDFAAAANEVERLNEAGGTYARSDARVPKTEQSRSFNRDNRFQR
ncbi:LOW QUALITY PROTEIN: hypothetical protein PHMEG_00026676 [Phytophthora megakarya]|uniref:Uncharacterized protein n=1 Tax=Phytophthora megakarya TaxID=4795 RepID=A0A225V915_9STRA|nr:LOW QUALITY PROTEIN: hypothetical protein PHMEG_00026676 [Phytophthora megakarya]